MLVVTYNTCLGFSVLTWLHLGFYRATACNATHGIAIAILTVRPSDVCIVAKLNNALRIF